MKILLTSEESIRLEPTPGPMTIEAESPDQLYSPYHMLGSSFAFCTYSLLASWAQHAKIKVDGLTLDVAWTFADEPHRVGTIAVTFDWPELPSARRVIAERVAARCPIHLSFVQPPTITIALAHAALSAAAPAPAGSTATATVGQS